MKEKWEKYFFVATVIFNIIISTVFAFETTWFDKICIQTEARK